MIMEADPENFAAQQKDCEGNLPIHSACELAEPNGAVVSMLADMFPGGLQQKDKRRRRSGDDSGSLSPCSPRRTGGRGADGGAPARDHARDPHIRISSLPRGDARGYLMCALFHSPLPRGRSSSSGNSW